MPKAPPLLPAEVLRRVLRLARLDGTGLLVIAGGLALLSAYYHDTTSTVEGLLVAGAGAFELQGAGLLRHGRPQGMGWLVSSQLYLITVILGCVMWQLTHVDISPLRLFVTPFVTDEWRQQLEFYKMTEDDFLNFFYVLIWGCIAVATLVYQGGMAIYYVRRRRGVAAALHELHG